MVGAEGFEPSAFWSRTKRATRLRYAPQKRQGVYRMPPAEVNRDFCARGGVAHLRNSPSGFLIMGNNYLKQHSFGVRTRGLAAPL